MKSILADGVSLPGRHLKNTLLSLLLAAVAVSGCTVNPVTGKRDLGFVSEQQEVALGTEHYGPMQQAEGGRYVLDPELTKYVAEVGQRLAKVSDRPELPYEFVVINSSIPNAWAMPGGKIAINRGLLLQLDSEAELAAVMGHEIVHAAARHGAQNMERGMLLQTGVLALGVATREHSHAGLLLGGAQVGAALVSTRYGRHAELEADYYGMQYMARAGYDPLAAVQLQETFLRLSEGRQSNWLEGLFASHPPSRERIDANRNTAAKLPKGLKLGREEYQARIASLKASQEAYEQHDAGRRALAQNDPAKAQQLAERAIAAEPREALFYGLKGDALAARKRLPEARTAYDEAIRRNGDFFYFHLQRGLLRQEVGDHAGARADLERSIALLPTTVAHSALGRQALARGDQGSAAQHFGIAAGGSGEAARSAAAELARLELPAHPERYLSVATALDAQGRLTIAVGNRSEIAVTAVTVEVTLVDSAGRALQRERLTLNEQLAPGSQHQSVLELPAPGGRDSLQRVHARVVSARAAN